MRKTIIRLQRKGGWKKPVYDVVVIYKDKRVYGDYLERIGFYDPTSTEKVFFIDLERFSYWVSNGTTVSLRVLKLLSNLGSYYKIDNKK